MIGLNCNECYNKNVYKTFKTLCLMALIPLLVTCTPAGSGSFDVTLSGNKLILIDAPTSTCSGVNSGMLDTGIAAVQFQLQSMTVKWDKPQFPLTIQWVEFMTTTSDINNGQPYSCMIAATDLMNTWVQTWNVLNATTGTQACKDINGVTAAPPKCSHWR